MYKQFGKRFFDIMLSGILLIFALPFILIIAALLYLFTFENPFFIHSRPGKNGKLFKLVKFKTMNNKRNAEGSLLSDKERITKIGRFLRATSLDEIPQMFNVLIGDMSLIGPRPLLVRYLDLYTPLQARRHEVRPGITGWAQVNGRNAISWEEKFTYDIYYIENFGIQLDLQILLLTIQKVLIRQGINNKEAATMPEFKGSQIKN